MAIQLHPLLCISRLTARPSWPATITDCGFGERKSRAFVSERSTENLKGCVDATMGTLLNYRTRIEDFREHTT